MTEPATTNADAGRREPASLSRTMLRPRWLLALLLALLVAAGFAFLGRWQLGRAVQSDVSATRVTEKVVPLTRAIKPNGPIPESAIGQKVTVTGRFDPADYRVIADRLNGGESGYWVAAHFMLESPDAAGRSAALAIARGWVPTEADARAVIRELRTQPEAQTTVTGRVVPTEAPELPDPQDDPHTMTTMSVAALYNLWSDVGGTDVYSAYVVQFDPPAGLSAIDAPPPLPPTTINWLNLFYAVEWAVFAAFAVYMWYRLVRDSWQREIEDAGEDES